MGFGRFWWGLGWFECFLVKFGDIAGVRGFGGFWCVWVDSDWF